MKKLIPVIVAMTLLCLCILSLLYYFFVPNNNIVAAFNEGELQLFIEGKLDESTAQPIIKNEEVLLPFSTVKRYFDPNIFWDDALKKVTVTTNDKVIRMKTDNLNALINNKPVTLKIPVVEEEGTVYVPIEFLSDFYSIELTYYKDKNVVMIDYKNSVQKLAEPIKSRKAAAPLRKGPSIRYPIVKVLDLKTANPGDNVLRIFEEGEKWYKVRTVDGVLGYIEKKLLGEKSVTKNEPVKEEMKNEAWKPEKGKINLVWDMLYDNSANAFKSDEMEGVDVVSPTWFQVSDENGILINRADAGYVNQAHVNGYKVWALVSNDFGGPDKTRKLLRNTDARDNVIRQLLVFAALYKLDGINIDFENIYKNDKDLLTQFVREAVPLLREQGLIVSVDVTVPDGSDNWSLCYDRKALGEIVDYVMLMAYDQHWASSPQAGSVAQLTWVEKNVQKVLKMVPKEKLLLGLPFYTRLWKEETGEDGKIKVSNPNALSMESARGKVEENKAKMVWDAESGQYYAEYVKDGSTYKLWLEDPTSINYKSSLIQKYELAGAAAWKKSDATAEVWQVLNNNLKGINGYSEWLAVNGKNPQTTQN